MRGHPISAATQLRPRWQKPCWRECESTVVIYLDHAATTPILPEARDAMLRALAETPGNPASAHAAGRRARQVLEDARERVAKLLHAEPSEVIFTSGAT